MATLRERKTHRDRVLRVPYEAVEGNRFFGSSRTPVKGLAAG